MSQGRKSDEAKPVAELKFLKTLKFLRISSDEQEQMLSLMLATGLRTVMPRLKHIAR